MYTPTIFITTPPYQHCVHTIIVVIMYYYYHSSDFGIVAQ